MVVCVVCGVGLVCFVMVWLGEEGVGGEWVLVVWLLVVVVVVVVVVVGVVVVEVGGVGIGVGGSIDKKMREVVVTMQDERDKCGRMLEAGS